MTTHEKHPSIVALTAQKRVQQFKQLFELNNLNNYNEPSNSNINYNTPSNSNINYNTPRQLRKNESIEIIIGHSTENRSISSWLEISDDDNDNEYINNDINNEIDNEIDINECDNEEILEISATLTLSPSYGESDTLYYNTILPLQQSITSPTKSSKPFTFEQDENIYIKNNNNSLHLKTNSSKQIENVNHTNNIHKVKVQKQRIIKEWKPITNETEYEHKSTDSLLMLQNRKLVNRNLDKKDKILGNKVYKKGPSESLILLQNKKLVNNVLKCFTFIDENNEDNDEFQVCDNVENRPLPVWLDDIQQTVYEVEINLPKQHTKELTDVLD